MRRMIRMGLALIVVGIVSPVHAGLTNELKGNPSPYLAMHGDDPVHWQTWGGHVMERARRENKLVYISIGYFACHWCHVMQRESYRNAEIAAFLNRHFIPVKVDRELHPALDARLIEFVERTRGYSGWPLNVFVTPEGYPLVGIVYLPPDNFRSLLQKIEQRWRTDEASLRQMAKGAAQALEQGGPSPGPDLPANVGTRYREALVTAALKVGDPMAGGFFEPNKFPMAPQMLALLDAYRARPGDELGAFLRVTLDHMASQGLRDQLRGGFFRYVVDPNWQVPHFEKMLYDNALLAELYMKAARVLDAPDYERVARDTLDFMLRELRSPQKAMIASLSAVDDQGVEGGYYLWDEATLEGLLSPDERRVISAIWGLSGSPDLEHGHLPVRALSPQQAAEQLGLSRARVQALFESAQEKLRQAQRNRTLPRDDKLLAAWNGLALRALSLGARLDGGDAYRDAARGVRDYLANALWTGERLLRARAASGGLGDASLEDYAYVASGLVHWAQLSGKDADYRLAREIVHQAWRRFHTPNGWKMAEQSHIAYGTAEPVIADGPMPSPSSVLIEATLQLARHDGDDELRRRALTALNAGRETLDSDPFWFASQIRVIGDVES